MDDFTPEDRYFYLYLLTNPHTNLCGCYEVSVKQMSDELGYSKETVEKLMNRFENIHKQIIYDVQTKEMLIFNWNKYNWSKSPQFHKALNAEMGKIKSDKFREYLISRMNDDTVCIPYPYPMDTTVTVSATVSDNNTISYNINNNSISNKRILSDVNDKSMTSQPCQDTDIDIDIEKDKDKETILKEKYIKEKSPRHKYGQYSNVLLSDEDMEKLKVEFPNDWENRIERLSEYMASTGKSYKSHLATIRNWAKRDKENASTSSDGWDYINSVARGGTV